MFHFLGYFLLIIWIIQITHSHKSSRSFSISFKWMTQNPTLLPMRKPSKRQLLKGRVLRSLLYCWFIFNFGCSNLFQCSEVAKAPITQLLFIHARNFQLFDQDTHLHVYIEGLEVTVFFPSCLYAYIFPKPFNKTDPFSSLLFSVNA